MGVLMKRGCCAAGLLAAIASAASMLPATVYAQSEDWRQRGAARVVIRFEGGLLSDSIATFVERLATLPPASVPTNELEPNLFAGDYCAALAKQLKIPLDACSDRVTQAFKRFSRQHAGKAQRSFPLVLPAFDVDRITFKRNFEVSDEAGREKLRSISKNTEWLKGFVNETIITEQSAHARSTSTADSGSSGSETGGQGGNPLDGSERVVASIKPFGFDNRLSTDSGTALHSLEFEGIRWTMYLPTAELVPLFEITAFEIGNSNLKIAVEAAEVNPTSYPRKFSSTPLAGYNQCVAGGDPFRSTYAAFLSTPESNEYKAAYNCDVPARETEVFILDTPVAKHPDLLQALGETPPAATPAQCAERGDYLRATHHGTYLAGIIGATGNKSGFEGLSQQVRITSYAWTDQSSEIDLHDFLEEKRDLTKPQIFLVAGEFARMSPESTPEHLRPEQWVKKDGTYQRILKNSEVRWKLHRNLNVLLREQRMITVVAAGQSDSPLDPPPGIDISATYAESPQNLGDLNTVIVVSGCNPCDADPAQIWPPSYVSAPGQHMVQLLAPSGEIPGLIDETKIAKTFAGTSGAAAFVAGVVANMLSCHAEYIAKPQKVKEWLMLTARKNLQDNDYARISAGTLDPAKALIDPSKSWITISGMPISTLELDHWCGPSDDLELSKDADGSEPAGDVELRDLRQLTRVGTGKVSATIGGANPQEKMGYSDGARPLASGKIGGKGTCAFRLDQVKFMLLHKANRSVKSCQSVPTCE